MKDSEKRQRFSIRKHTLGAASVLIGSTVIGTSVASADTQTLSCSCEIINTQDTAQQPAATQEPAGEIVEQMQPQVEQVTDFNVVIRVQESDGAGNYTVRDIKEETVLTTASEFAATKYNYAAEANADPSLTWVNTIEYGNTIVFIYEPKVVTPEVQVQPTTEVVTDFHVIVRVQTPDGQGGYVINDWVDEKVTTTASEFATTKYSYATEATAGANVTLVNTIEYNNTVVFVYEPAAVTPTVETPVVTPTTNTTTTPVEATQEYKVVLVVDGQVIVEDHYIKTPTDFASTVLDPYAMIDYAGQTLNRVSVESGNTYIFRYETGAATPVEPTVTTPVSTETTQQTGSVETEVVSTSTETATQSGTVATGNTQGSTTITLSDQAVHNFNINITLDGQPIQTSNYQALSYAQYLELIAALKQVMINCGYGFVSANHTTNVDINLNFTSTVTINGTTVTPLPTVVDELGQVVSNTPTGTETAVTVDVNQTTTVTPTNPAPSTGTTEVTTGTETPTGTATENAANPVSETPAATETPAAETPVTGNEATAGVVSEWVDNNTVPATSQDITDGTGTPTASEGTEGTTSPVSGSEGTVATDTPAVIEAGKGASAAAPVSSSEGTSGVATPASSGQNVVADTETPVAGTTVVVPEASSPAPTAGSDIVAPNEELMDSNVIAPVQSDSPVAGEAPYVVAPAPVISTDTVVGGGVAGANGAELQLAGAAPSVPSTVRRTTQSENTKGTLPKTGEESNLVALAGAGILTTALGVATLRRQED